MLSQSARAADVLCQSAENLRTTTRHVCMTRAEYRVLCSLASKHGFMVTPKRGGAVDLFLEQPLGQAASAALADEAVLGYKFCVFAMAYSLRAGEGRDLIVPKSRAVSSRWTEVLAHAKDEVVFAEKQPPTRLRWVDAPVYQAAA